METNLSQQDTCLAGRTLRWVDGGGKRAERSRWHKGSSGKTEVARGHLRIGLSDSKWRGKNLNNPHLHWEQSSPLLKHGVDVDKLVLESPRKKRRTC